MACSILVPSSVSNSTFKRLSRLAKKAGVEVSQVAGESKIYRRTYQGEGRKRVLDIDTTQVLRCSRITVGDMPVANGFTFVGKIMHTEAGNLLASGFGARSEEIPVEWRDAKPTCDHCHTSRRRAETFLIRTPQGGLYRVGRNCLADFLMSDPNGLIALDEFQDMIREISERDPDEYSGRGFGGWDSTPLHFLACAFSSVESKGFIKRDAAGPGRVPTADDALFLALSANASAGAPKSRKAWREGQPTAEHFANAVSALCWLDESTDTSDYIHNLKVGLQMHTACKANTGLIASLPTAYARYLGKIAERTARAARPDAGYVGELEQRIDLEVTVLRVQNIESVSRWTSSKDLIGFCTSEGHECVTFSTSANSPRTSDVGSVFLMRGTVDAHTEYKGVKQTRFQRCSWEKQ